MTAFYPSNAYYVSQQGQFYPYYPKPNAPQMAQATFGYYQPKYQSMPVQSDL